MKIELDIIDFGGGNVGSLKRCFDRLGVTYEIRSGANPPEGDRPLVLPGVGSFGAVMRSLKSSGLDVRIKELISEGTSFLGICVGMQVLFEGSQESANEVGLGIMPGQVVRFNARKVPQIGWNEIHSRAANWESGYAYFVNSYCVESAPPQMVLYEADYEQTFCAGLQSGNITAFQFHPEKSGRYGAALLSKWVKDVTSSN